MPARRHVLMLRPTESPTLFLQQLGRGLRKSSRQDRSARSSTSWATSEGVPLRPPLPRAARRQPHATRTSRSSRASRSCRRVATWSSTQVAQEIVLANIREAIPSRWPPKVEELRGVARDGPARDACRSISQESGLDLEDVYDGSQVAGRICCEAAGVIRCPRPGPHETALRRACGRLLHVDDDERLDDVPATPRCTGSRLDVGGAWPSANVGSFACSSPPMVDQRADKTTTLRRGVSTLLWSHPQVLRELLELLDVLDADRPHLHHALAPASRRPAAGARALHARSRSSRRSASATAPRSRPGRPACTGPKDASADLLAFTLDKTRAASRRRPATATTRSAASSSTGRASRSTGGQRDGPALSQPRCDAARRSCCSLACGPTTAPSGSSGRRPTAASR